MKTLPGATAVQIVYSFRRGWRAMEHLGSAHSDAEVELLTAVGWRRPAAGRGEPDLACGLRRAPVAGRCLNRQARKVITWQG